MKFKSPTFTWREIRKDFTIITVSFISGFLCLLYIYGKIVPISPITIIGALIILLLFPLPIFFALKLKIFAWFTSVTGGFAKYAVVGFGVTTLDLATLNFLVNVLRVKTGVMISLLNLVSLSIALIPSYFANKYWTFKKSNVPHSLAEYGKFLFTTAAALLINSLIVYLGLRLTVSEGSLIDTSTITTVKLIALIVFIVINFYTYKNIVFKHAPSNPPKPADERLD